MKLKYLFVNSSFEEKDVYNILFETMPYHIGPITPLYTLWSLINDMNVNKIKLSLLCYVLLLPLHKLLSLINYR